MSSLSSVQENQGSWLNLAYKAISEAPQSLYQAFSSCLKSSAKPLPSIAVVNPTPKIWSNLSDLLKQAEDEVNSLKSDQLQLSLDRLSSIHTASVACLDTLRKSPELTLEAKAQLEGQFTKKWMAIDNSFSKLSVPPHAFCGCQFQAARGFKKHEHLKLPEPLLIRSYRQKLLPSPANSSPLDIDLRGKSFWFVSHQCGGGHPTLQFALAERVGRCGGHVFYADGPEEILIDLDVIHQKMRWLGKKIPGLGFENVTKMSVARWIISKGFLSIIKHLDSKYQREQDEVYKEWTHLFKCHMISRGADLAVSAYTRHLEPIHIASGQLGIGLYAAATDYDSRITGVMEKDKNPHSYIATYTNPFDQTAQADLVIESLRKRKQDGEGYAIDITSNLLYGGLPVAERFLQEFSPSHLKEIYGIDADSQFILCLGGGASTNTKELQAVAAHFSTQKKVQLHVLKVCGGNPAALRNILKDFTSKYGNPEKGMIERGGTNYPLFTFQVGKHFYSLIGEAGEIMGELIALTTFPNRDGFEGFVLSTKSGGGTLREVHAVGARILIQRRNDSAWETGNRLIFEAGQWAKSFEDDKDCMVQTELLLSEKQTEDRVEQILKFRTNARQSPERSMMQFRQILDETKKDFSFSEKKESGIEQISFVE